MEQRISLNQFKSLQKELENIKKKAEEYLNGWKRAKADYINREKEIEKEKIEWVKFANTALILQLLPILDNLKTANNQQLTINSKKEIAWMEGIKQITRQLENLLKSLGVEEIKTVGEKFDPNLHESVGKEKADEKEESVIIKTVEAGYKLHGRVIKPAKVIVSE